MSLLVCGHTNVDVQLSLEKLPKADESAPVLERRVVHGGTACNIARHAASLGVPTRLWSRVGDDFPADWRETLEAGGVDLSCLDVVAGGRTPTCYVLTSADGSQAYCMDQGPMGTMIEAPPRPGFLQDTTKWLHLATGAPAAYMDLATAARKEGISVALDPGQELRFAYDTRSFERLLDLADVLFVNETEARIACSYLSYGDPVQLLDHLQTLVVTRGSGGATLYTPKGRVDQQPFVVTAVDPTGAGDALRAGWYAAMHEGHSSEVALQWGQAAAAVAVQHLGPQEHPVTREDIHALTSPA